MPPPQATGSIRFGAFEVDALSVALRKHGVRVRLQNQPFRVLLALLEKPGELVTREELHQRVWASESFGDFDHSLNIAVNKIREALGDSAEAPRFVETVPRRGYRFIAEVEGPAEPVPAARAQRVSGPLWIWAPAAAVVLVAAGLITSALWPAPAPELQVRRLTNDSLPKYPPVLSDGTRLYFRVFADRGGYIAQIPISGGEPARLPIALPSKFFVLCDISPDGQELLLAEYPITDPLVDSLLWAVRVADGSSRRVGSMLGRDAAYSPDGRQIAFTAGGVRAPGSLFVASSDGANPRRLLEVPGLQIVTPYWSPDGTRIGFGQVDRAAQHRSAWVMMADGTNGRRLFPDWGQSHLPAGWTPNGRLFLSQSQSQFWVARQGRWFFPGEFKPPLQLTISEPVFQGPVRFRSGRGFYAIGRTPLGQLQRYDTRSKSWEPHFGGISAECVEYSRDAQRVAYVTYPGGDLWVRRADGSGPTQLTKAPLIAYIVRWSPDDRFLAFMGRAAPDQPFRTYLVESVGGTPRLASPRDTRPQGDLTWSPDGKKIVFSPPSDEYASGAELYLRVLDLDTGEITRFPGSEGLFSPRWSPDGSALLAVPVVRNSTGGRHLMLNRASHGKWEEIATPGDPTWPAWSSDGKSLWYYAFGEAIMRCDVRKNRCEKVVPFKFEEMTGLWRSWFSVTSNNEPMILRRHDLRQVYALEWKMP